MDLASKLSSGSLCPKTTLTLSNQVLSGKRRSRPDSVEDNALLMLSSVPRSSDSVAKALLREFGSIRCICNASEEQVAAVVRVGAALQQLTGLLQDLYPNYASRILVVEMLDEVTDRARQKRRRAARPLLLARRPAVVLHQGGAAAGASDGRARRDVREWRLRSAAAP